MNWKTKDSTYIVNDRWLQLRADTCETLEGVEITPYYVFEYPNWVSVVVIDDQGMTWILDQYRHGVGSVVREIVAGAIEGDETPEQAARREVREELGYEGGECIELGKGYANPANQTNTVYFMLIQGGSVTRDQELEVGETLVAHATPWEDFIQEVHQGTTTYQSLHLSAILLAEKYLSTQ